MYSITQTEFVTLTLYIATVSLLLIAMAARREPTQKVSAMVSMLFGVLASVSLYACITGKADSWSDYDPSAARSAAAQKKNGASSGGGGSGGGDEVEKAGAGGEDPGHAAATESAGSTAHQEEAEPGPLGFVLASFNLTRSPKLSNKPFRDCQVCPEMIVVPSGFAPLGSDDSDPLAGKSEKPQRIVRITKPFAIGRFEITRKEFETYLSSTGTQPALCSNVGEADPRAPAECVSWQQANAYVTWLSVRTGKTYRLPTSGEWEYAARARTGTPYPSGVTLRAADANLGFEATSVTPVGAYQPNGFGLSDMTGNVAELVADCWLENLRDAPTDGSSAYRGADCRKRTLRDAAWFEAAHLGRAAARRPIALDAQSKGVGFRVVRDMR